MLRFCSEVYLSPFLLYLPFTLLLAPIILTSCEKIFIAYVSSTSLALIFPLIMLLLLQVV